MTQVHTHPTQTTPTPHTVVVLHGWGLSNFATRYWCKYLEKNGFYTAPFSYASRALGLQDNASKLAEHIAAIPAHHTVHFLGHSLGGIVILQALATHTVANLGKVVMVGTPFARSYAMHRLNTRPWGAWLLGKTITQWHGLTTEQLPAQLELGTIAGTKPFGIGRIFGKLPQPHDGTVTLAETEVPFAKDRVILPVTHSEMLISRTVCKLIVQFFRTGTFNRLSPAHPHTTP